MLFLCSILESAKGQASHCFVFAEVYEECIHAKFCACVLFVFFMGYRPQKSIHHFFLRLCLYRF